MRKFTNNEIAEIRKNINNGMIYVPVQKNGKAFGGAIFHSPYPSKFITWRYYGQSAIKDTNKQLRWLLETIFDDCEDITEAVWNEYLIDYIPLKDELVLDRERQPHMKLENIKIEGRIGTWYEIDDMQVGNDYYKLFESCVYGDEAGAILVKLPQEKFEIKDHVTRFSSEKVYFIPKECEVAETWDDIETALEDEGIL